MMKTYALIIALLLPCMAPGAVRYDKPPPQLYSVFDRASSPVQQSIFFADRNAVPGADQRMVHHKLRGANALIISGGAISVLAIFMLVVLIAADALTLTDGRASYGVGLFATVITLSGLAGGLTMLFSGVAKRKRYLPLLSDD